jgi:hypothetical protein
MLIELIEICPTSYDLHGYTVKSNSRNMCGQWGDLTGVIFEQLGTSY